MIVKYINNSFYDTLKLNGVYPVLSFEEERFLIGDGNEIVWLTQNYFNIIKNKKCDYIIEKNIETPTYTHKNLANKEFLLKFYLEEEEYDEIKNLILITEKEIFEKECEFEELIDYLNGHCNNEQIYYIILDSLLTKVSKKEIERFIKVISNILDDFEGDLLIKLINLLTKYQSLEIFNIICDIYSTKKIIDKNVILLLENYIMNYN